MRSDSGSTRSFGAILRNERGSLAPGGSGRSFVRVDDLRSRGEPHVLAFADVGECLVEVLAAVRMADQERMKANRHDARALGAVLVEPVELIADHPRELLAAAPHLEEGRNV